MHVISFQKPTNARQNFVTGSKINLDHYDDNDPASCPDEENPEWTMADFKKARPGLDVIAELFGTEAAQSLKRGCGRPEKADKKVNQTLRLDPDALEAYKQEGNGWQTRMNQVLRDHMPGSHK